MTVDDYDSGYRDWFDGWRRADESRALDRELARITAEHAKEREEAARKAVDDELIDAAWNLQHCAFTSGAEFERRANRWVQPWLRKHNITATWTEGRPAAANVRRRQITVPPLRSVNDLATVLHEGCHVLAGECRGRGHQPNVSRGYLHCLKCEVAADTLVLKHWPLDARMHAELARYLRTYRATTPAPADVQRAADQFISGRTWREQLHERVNHELRMERFREMQEIAREARQGGRNGRNTCR